MQKQEQVNVSDFGEYNDKHVYYHYVEVNKYRNELFTNEIAIKLKEIYQKIADINDWIIYELRIEKEHIHLLFSASPEWIPTAIDNNEDYDGIEFEDGYLFCWNNTHINNEEMLEFLEKYSNIKWAKTVELCKSNDGRTINIINGANSAEITIDDKEEKAYLKINQDRPTHLKIKRENGLLNIYVNKYRNGIIYKLKGPSSIQLRDEFPSLKKHKNTDKKHLWSGGGYIGTISQDKNPPYVANEDYEYKKISAAHKVHILYFFYRIRKDKLEELIGYNNLMQFKPAIEDITEPVERGFIFDNKKFKTDGDYVSFLIRSKQTFPPIWILKSIFKRLIENPADDQMKDWLNSWYISSQGPKFNTVQDYIDSHDDPYHGKKMIRHY